MSDSLYVEITTKTIYGVSYDAIFTTIATILIFVLGILTNRLITHLREKRRLKELEKYYLDLITSLIKPIEKQANAFEELSQNISDRDSRNFEFNENSDLLFENISNIPQLDIYKIFITNRKSADESKFIHFKNILNSVEFVRLQLDRTKHNFLMFFEDNRRYEEQWNINCDTIVRHFDIFLSNAKSDNIPPSEDPFLKELDKILHALQQIENSRNLHVVKENFIDPLKLLCKQYITDQRALQLLPFIVHAKYAFRDIINVKEYYSKSFNDEAKKLSDRKKLIIEAISYFENVLE